MIGAPAPTAPTERRGDHLGHAPMKHPAMKHPAM
jgi:hypothetical protein